MLRSDGLVFQQSLPILFAGNISARQEWRHAYLIDGVAINGVSGGPVMYSTEAEGVQIVGSISAYVSNRATGETLPGLAIARDVSYLHDTISKIKSLDEASKQKKEQQSQEITSSASQKNRQEQPKHHLVSLNGFHLTACVAPTDA